jgi:hypothetical protein
MKAAVAVRVREGEKFAFKWKKGWGSCQQFLSDHKESSFEITPFLLDGS